MKLKFNAIAVMLIVITVLSCADKKLDRKKPDDFSFFIVGATDKYDSGSGIYTRRYIKVTSKN